MPIVNKKGCWDCSSCLFVLSFWHGACSMSWDKRYPNWHSWGRYYITYNDLNLNLLCGPSWVTPWCRYSYSQGMRHSTHTLSSTLLIFAFTLNFNHSRCYDKGVMRAWHQYHIANINLSRSIWKIDETCSCFSSTHLYIFPKCPPFMFRFTRILYDHYRMFLLFIMHTFSP